MSMNALSRKSLGVASLKDLFVSSHRSTSDTGQLMFVSAQLCWQILPSLPNDAGCPHKGFHD